VGDNPVDPLPDEIRVTLDVAEILEELGVRYLVCGSVASSVHGEPRATRDVDLVTDLAPCHVDRLVRAVEERFYISAAAARSAVERSACFNVIHLETMVKVDIFCAKPGAATERQLARRQLHRLGPEGPGLWIQSPEDTIASKLEWFRRGGEVSEQQWRDILGVLKVQGADLDRAYLTELAAMLHLDELLHRALADAGL